MRTGRHTLTKNSQGYPPPLLPAINTCAFLQITCHEVFLNLCYSSAAECYFSKDGNYS